MTYKPHIHQLQQYLVEKDIDAILITDPANITYLSGFLPLSPTEREAYLLITKKSAHMMTSPLYLEEANAQDFIVHELSGKQTLTKTIKNILKEEDLESLAFEEYNLKFFEYERLAKAELPLIPMVLDTLRLRKDAQEIEAIAQACAIGDKAFAHILTKITEGITEEQVALELELFIRKEHGVLSFPSIIAFGENAAVPHHVTGNRKLKKNEFVLLDFGVKIDSYCSDMSRTVFFGTPSAQQKHAYETVFTAQQKAIDYIMTEKEPDAARADKLAREYITANGFPSFPHSLGHGIGLEVHESPSLSPYSEETLSTGMVFSVEPGIYVPGKYGIRIEDLVAITESGSALLTNAPRELITLSS